MRKGYIQNNKKLRKFPEFTHSDFSAAYYETLACFGNPKLPRFCEILLFFVISISCQILYVQCTMYDISTLLFLELYYSWRCVWSFLNTFFVEFLSLHQSTSVWWLIKYVVIIDTVSSQVSCLCKMVMYRCRYIWCYC